MREHWNGRLDKNLDMATYLDGVTGNVVVDLQIILDVSGQILPGRTWRHLSPM